VDVRRPATPDILTGGGGVPVAMLPHGSVIVRDGAHRRVLELDRAGALLAAYGWRPEDGLLATASLALADGRWLSVEPRATDDAPWGRSDRLWLAPAPGFDGASPLTVLQALDWCAIDTIPVVAEPSALPAGAGTVLLNAIAALAADQQCAAISYRGPYPSEALFLSLLESFRFDAASGDPLAAFIEGALAWHPAPHERARERDGITVQLRGRVEKVMWQGRTYYRSDWQSIERAAPRRVRDDGGGVVCSLEALGQVIEDHLRLDVDGRLVEILGVPATERPRVPVPAQVAHGVVAAVAATSMPALASFVREAGQDLRLEWGRVDRDLAAVDADRVCVSWRLRDVAASTLRRSHTRRESVGLGFALLGEIAGLVGDGLRARAQAFLLAAGPEAQARALRVTGDEHAEESARVMGRAVEALLTDLAAR
jgi:hypothetical protein